MDVAQPPGFSSFFPYSDKFYISILLILQFFSSCCPPTVKGPRTTTGHRPISINTCFLDLSKHLYRSLPCFKQFHRFLLFLCWFHWQPSQFFDTLAGESGFCKYKLFFDFYLLNVKIILFPLKHFKDHKILLLIGFQIMRQDIRISVKSFHFSFLYTILLQIQAIHLLGTFLLFKAHGFSFHRAFPPDPARAFHLQLQVAISIGVSIRHFQSLLHSRFGVWSHGLEFQHSLPDCMDIQWINSRIDHLHCKNGFW